MVPGSMTILKGMDVYGQRGERMGQVGNIWTQTAPAAATSRPGMGHTRNSSPPPEVAVGIAYFEVRGQEESGEKSVLYVPGGAVSQVQPGQSVTLNCSRDECLDRYGGKPDFLQAP